MYMASISSSSPRSLVETVLREKFEGNPPFRGDKRFAVVKSDDDRPRALVNDALLDGRAVAYEVAVTCDELKEPDRFVYQYSHELAHFWFTPIEHPFLEVCAVAISLSVLSLCAEEWKQTGSSHVQKRYSQGFENYRRRVEQGAAEQFRGLGVEEYMSRGSAAALSSTVRDEHIAAGAALAKQVLDKQSSWLPLISLHSFVCQDDTGLELLDFDLWEQSLDPTCESHRVFANDVIRLFSSTFGVMKQVRPSFLEKLCCRCLKA